MEQKDIPDSIYWTNSQSREVYERTRELDHRLLALVNSSEVDRDLEESHRKAKEIIDGLRKGDIIDWRRLLQPFGPIPKFYKI